MKIEFEPKRKSVKPMGTAFPRPEPGYAASIRLTIALMVMLGIAALSLMCACGDSEPKVSEKDGIVTITMSEEAREYREHLFAQKQERQDAAKQNKGTAKQNEGTAKQNEASAKQNEASAKQNEASAKQNEASAKQTDGTAGKTNTAAAADSASEKSESGASQGSNSSESETGKTRTDSVSKLEFPDVEISNELTHETCAGSDVYSIAPAGSTKSIVLFVHGGAFVHGINKAHVEYCDELATKLDARVYIPQYPLAPENTYRETYSMMTELYKELKEQGKPVYVLGESAGGTIAVGLVLRLEELGEVLPDKMILMAPVADGTYTNEDIKNYEDKDCKLTVEGCSKCAAMWSGGDDLANPVISPVYGDMKGFPDTIMFLGTYDILYPDNRILCDNMVEAGVNVELVVGEGLWHVFPVSKIPERDLCMNMIEEFLNQ